MKKIAAIILAAGKGMRMKSSVPKVLHEVCGLPMVGWVLRSLEQSGISDSCLILNDELEPFAPLLAAFKGTSVAIQQNRLGTGDAAASAAWSFKDVVVPGYAAGRHHQGPVINSEYVLICAGDIPAVDAGEYQKFLKFCYEENVDLAVLGMNVPDPTGYGRLVLDGNILTKIVEEKDASAEIKKIRVCNTGILFFKTKVLFELLSRLTTENAQKEYYLTDCIGLARARGLICKASVSENYPLFQGVNDRIQLASIEGLINRRLINQQMLSGVTFQLPETSFIETGVEIGADSVIGPGFTGQGKSKIGKRCRVGSGVTLYDAVIGDDVEIGNHCDIKKMTVADGDKIYPGNVLGLS